MPSQNYEKHQSQGLQTNLVEKEPQQVILGVLLVILKDSKLEAMVEILELKIIHSIQAYDAGCLWSFFLAFKIGL